MKKLVIGKIPNKFNKKDHIVFNSYSFENNETNFNRYEIYSFINKDDFNLENLDKDSANLVKNYIKKNVDKFNSKYDQNRSYIFYKTLFYPWLITVIQSYIERYLQLKTFLKSIPDPVEVELIKNDKHIKFKNTQDIHDALSSIEFNENDFWFMTRK